MAGHRGREERRRGDRGEKERGERGERGERERREGMRRGEETKIISCPLHQSKIFTQTLRSHTSS